MGKILTLYTRKMMCAICKARRAKRFCPGVHGDICTFCCGTEREVSVSCPLDCEYLREARRHEKPLPIDEKNIPHPDIRVTEKLLASSEELLSSLAAALADAALATPGASDRDVRDALDALIRTYRTLEAGVYYETRPENAVAQNLFRLVQEALARFRSQEHERLGMSRTRDSEILMLLVFLERLELDRDNGRPRGRAFIDLLRGLAPGRPEAGAGVLSPLVLP